MSVLKSRGLAFSVLLVVPVLSAASPAGHTVPIGETPAIGHHYDQAAIDAGHYSFDELFEAGRQLFDARFNILDGQGRPESTGGGAARGPGQPPFIRTSGPDANACVGCHAQPRSGGAGDFVANVFVLAQVLDPVTRSIDGAFSNERNTLGMFGAGAIEMLAREMSAELIAIREAATVRARETGAPVTVPLRAKGVDFGAITVLPDGRVDPTAIDGVDWDLVVKPFHQKGAVVSLREFSNNAMNHHHGMQSSERFGHDSDADNDGMSNELTEGDITAVTLYQAALEAPRQAWPANGQARRAARQGKALFSEIGCGRCHRPSLLLASREFTEPNPYNPPGNLRPQDVDGVYRFDLVRTSRSPLVRPRGDGSVEVQAFTDLKRHDLNDDELNHFANEQVPQGFLHGFADPAGFTVPPQPRPTGEFLSRKLWDVGNSGPYGHRGDLTLMTEAIHFHGGDARAERDAFFALDDHQQAQIIEFLKTLVVADSRRD
ncbi:cytochrome c family protein [Marinihelvus fidelis]|nr:di-heme oxidoredictase family protein [Marinihelvus fidelis]